MDKIESKRIFHNYLEQIVQAHINIFNSSALFSGLSKKTELEIIILGCSDLMILLPNEFQQNLRDEFKLRIKQFLNWRFRQEFLMLPMDYFEMRLNDFINDLNSSFNSSYHIPKYSYHSLFKSPLRQFDINEIPNSDSLEIIKFKSIQLSIHQLNKEAIPFLIEQL